MKRSKIPAQKPLEKLTGIELQKRTAQIAKNERARNRARAKQGLPADAVLRSGPIEPGAWKDVFLAHYGQTGNISASCQAAGITRMSFVRAKNSDAEFLEAFTEAHENAIDTLEEVARQRALDGSDLLTIFLMKGMRPEKYRDAYKEGDQSSKTKTVNFTINLHPTGGTYKEGVSSDTPELDPVDGTETLTLPASSFSSIPVDDDDEG